MEKIQPAQINQIEENNVVNVKTIKSQNSDKTKPLIEENNISNTDIDDSENLNTENNEDEYEEIIFHDDFDKEYRSDVEDSYFDE